MRSGILRAISEMAARRRRRFCLQPVTTKARIRNPPPIKTAEAGSGVDGPAGKGSQGVAAAVPVDTTAQKPPFIGRSLKIVLVFWPRKATSKTLVKTTLLGPAGGVENVPVNSELGKHSTRYVRQCERARCPSRDIRRPELKIRSARIKCDKRRWQGNCACSLV